LFEIKLYPVKLPVKFLYINIIGNFITNH